MLSAEEAEAYVCARMPATFAALTAVFSELKKQAGRVQTLLDIGAGPGTGYRAAEEVFGALKRAHMVEINPHMQAIGQKALKGAPVTWSHEADLSKEYDLALFGYSYGEIDEEVRQGLLRQVFGVTKVVVVVEAGTPQGYRQMLEARDVLIGEGGEVMAPCPHARACPLGEGDWCHFSVRLARTREHKAAKGGALGWEDEKYSYIAVGKEKVEVTGARLLRAPQKRTGHVNVRLCTDAGIVDLTITKKEKELYKQARKARWGDSLFSKEVVEGRDDNTCD